MNRWKNNLPTDGQPTSDPVQARRRAHAATRFHYYHWLIILSPLLLSFIAWRCSEYAQEQAVQIRFDRECERTIELIKERLQNYEDVLWGSVAMIGVNGGDVDFEKWQTYTSKIDIEHKYPGVSGLGVVHCVEHDAVDGYIQKQRATRPDFRIYPLHQEKQMYPLSFVTPVAPNREAVGLDMAHERNRLEGIIDARDAGKARITGPIVLVQDQMKTPGFVFFAPFYKSISPDDVESRREQILGYVCAPFVVEKLMLGTLAPEHRGSGIRLSDGEDVLYDELVDSRPDFDSNPLLTQVCDIDVYGRKWRFEIWSSLSFREGAQSTDPVLIPIAGIVIDVFVFLLFLNSTRSARLALVYADAMQSNAVKLKASRTVALSHARRLENSNADLEQFASVASHDLQEPLRKVASFCALLKEEYADKLDEDGHTYIDYAIDGSKRMRTLVQNLLAFSKIGSEEDMVMSVDANQSLDNALKNLASRIEETDAKITSDTLPFVDMVEGRLVQMFQNLVGNSLKYRSEATPEIHIGVESREGETVLSVSDNGIGIPVEHRERVFGIFKRLHTRDEYSGTGIGLAICQRIVDRWNGRIWIERKSGPGCTEPGCKICFSLPKCSDTPVTQEVEKEYELVCL